MPENGGGAFADFDEFYVGAAPRVVRQLVLLTGDLAEAEDVTHEAFSRAWLRWSTLRSYESPETWVRTVARRLAVSRWRKLRRIASAPFSDTDPRHPHVPGLAEDHVANGEVGEMVKHDGDALSLGQLAKRGDQNSSSPGASRLQRSSSPNCGTEFSAATR